jgi:predicted MPP superfamily phosphohydrolase
MIFGMKGSTISFSYPASSSELRDMLGKKLFSVIILDVFLNEGKFGNNFTLKDVLDIITQNDINKGSPIVLISARWSETTSREINKAFQDGNCRTFLHFGDINDISSAEGGGRMGYAAEILTKRIQDHQGVDYTIHYGENDDIRILLISDVHIRGDEMNEELQKAFTDAVRKRWDGSSPTFIALTGDVTQNGDPDLYGKTIEWLRKVVDKIYDSSIILPSLRIMYVPGNHDVNIKLAAGARIQLEGRKPKNNLISRKGNIQRELLQYAFTPARNFFDSVSNRPLLPTNEIAWVDGCYRHLGVIFYGITTTKVDVFGDEQEDKLRFIDTDSLRLVGERIEELKKTCNNSTFIIGLMHHRPSLLSNKDQYRSELKTDLVLCGHDHLFNVLSDEEPPFECHRLVNCAPSFSPNPAVRGRDTLAAVSLIKLNRSGGIVNGIEIAHLRKDSDIWSVCNTKQYTYDPEKGFSK